MISRCRTGTITCKECTSVTVSSIGETATARVVYRKWNVYSIDPDVTGVRTTYNSGGKCYNISLTIDDAVSRTDHNSCSGLSIIYTDTVRDTASTNV